MSRLVTFFLCFCMVLFLTVSVGYAQDEAKAPAPDDVTEAQRDILHDRVDEIVQNLEQKDVNHFFVMYANYAIISTVKAVEGDVAGAVEGCAKNNPGLKDKVEDHFKKWQGGVHPVMEEATGNLNNMVLAQTYMPQADVQALFTMVDTVRAEDSSKFKTVPVTTPEACEFMMSKMDETQESMVTLLTSTMRTFPTVQRQSQQ